MLARAQKTLMLTGRIDFDTAVDVLAQGVELIEQHAYLVFDFSQVVYANSAILAVLLAWQRHAISCDKKIQFVHLPVSVIALVRLSRIEKILGLSGR